MNPRWLNWLFLIFLGYVLLVGNFRDTGEEAPVPVAEEESAEAPAKEYPKLAEVGDLERWKKALNPDYAALTEACHYEPPKDGLGVKIALDAMGEGEAAQCGQVITVTLRYWNAQGALDKKGSKTIVLGKHEVSPALEAALLGIRPGGERTIIVPAEEDRPVTIVTAIRTE